MKTRWLFWLVGAALAATVGGYFAAFSYFEARELRAIEARATLYKSTLISALDRFQHLPFILARDPAVSSAVDPMSRARLNLRLEEFADQSGLEAIYLMDLSGDTVSASNHRSELTFLGHNYGFRPYFKQATRGARGEFYAIGATTSRPGYFVAERVDGAAGDAIGVIAVKLDLSPLQNAWRAGGETVMVSNRDGVVVLSSEPELLYRTLREISPERRREISQERQFGAERLSPLDWREIAADQVALDGTRFMQATTTIPRLGWTLHYLSDRSRIAARSVMAAVAGAAALSLILVAAVALRSERLRAALQSSQSDRRALQQSNTELKQAQKELARASKMAAFGQLSASVTHELGQPIAAMRNYLAAAEISDEPAERDEVLGRLRSIVGRMENVTKQLRFFSNPAEPATDPVDLRRVIAGAELLVGPDIEASGASLDKTEPAAPVLVPGDQLRLEQVVVNLLRNAVAAMATSEERRLSVTLAQEEGVAVLEVLDTGHGIGEQTIEDLQEPFHTTRPSGEGMGLGLAIAASIIRDHGGALTARNREPVGAVFTVTLPLYQDAGAA